jgi:hypothetical protein
MGSPSSSGTQNTPQKKEGKHYSGYHNTDDLEFGSQLG